MWTAGYSCFHCDISVAISASAASSVASSARRAIAFNEWLCLDPRLAGSIVSGRQSAVAVSGKARPGRATPTTTRSTPVTRIVRPMMPWSPPYRRIQ